MGLNNAFFYRFLTGQYLKINGMGIDCMRLLFIYTINIKSNIGQELE